MDFQYINFLIAPSVTACLFYHDFRVKYDFSIYIKIWSFRSPLFKYILTYFIAGGIIYLSYYSGVKIFSKEPEDYLKSITTSHTKSYIYTILEGLLIGVLSRTFLTSKPIPLFQGSIESILEVVLLRKILESIHTRNGTAKSEFATLMIKTYKERNPSTDLDKKILGNKLITYHKQNKASDATALALVRDVASADTVHTALIMVMYKENAEKIKAILFETH